MNENLAEIINKRREMSDEELKEVVDKLAMEKDKIKNKLEEGDVLDEINLIKQHFEIDIAYGVLVAEQVRRIEGMERYKYLMEQVRKYYFSQLARILTMDKLLGGDGKWIPSVQIPEI